jgi:hypothetical protein
LNTQDIFLLFLYRKTELRQLDAEVASQHSMVFDIIILNFEQYGWTREELLDSNTRVAAALKQYIPHKGVRTGFGWLHAESSNKRRRIDRSEASAALRDHNIFSDSSSIKAAPRTDPRAQNNLKGDRKCFIQGMKLLRYLKHH